MGAAILRDGADHYGWQPSALLIASDGEVAGSTAELILTTGARLLATLSLADAVPDLASRAPVDLLVIEASDVSAADIIPIIDVVARFAHSGDVSVVIAINDQLIDLVGATMLGGRYDVLCAPSMVERFMAMSTALARDHGLRLTDATRDTESARLQRLNDEVARIAETLARLTSSGQRAATRPSMMGDRAIAYRADPGADPGDNKPPVSAAEVRQLIRARRLRDQFFGDSLFEDPAWDMLLDLYAADLERARVSVSSLCIAAAVAPTTALRWIGRMTDAGLFERQPDPFDRRRAYMALSAQAIGGMRGYFTAVTRLGPGLATV
jgi:hypothetical protein